MDRLTNQHLVLEHVSIDRGLSPSFDQLSSPYISPMPSNGKAASGLLSIESGAVDTMTEPARFLHSQHDSGKQSPKDLLEQNHSKRDESSNDYSEADHVEGDKANTGSVFHATRGHMSSLEQLFQQDIATLRDPVPGEVQFPGCFDLNGQRIPSKQVFAQPQKQILPPIDDPLWKQMLAYCQRWGVWVATVDNDKRRSELMEWVTKKMQEAWTLAISKGHCGEPNGHKQCCLAHGPDCSSGTGNKRVSRRDHRKKPVDPSKQLASFACEGGKHIYSIINSELDQVDIDMEMILVRVDPKTLEKGNELLSNICELLGRSTLTIKDWTTFAKFGKFDPRFNARNLLMFCLWEVQRCHGIIKHANQLLSKNVTTTQQKNTHKRIEVHRQRADQHLALAVMLDEKRPKEDAESSGSDDWSSNGVDEHPRRSTRTTRSAIGTEVLSDKDDEKEQNPDTDSKHKVSTYDSDRSESSGESFENSEEVEQVQHEDELTISDRLKQELCTETVKNSDDSHRASAVYAGEKRSLAEADADIGRYNKIPKYMHDGNTYDVAANDSKQQDWMRERAVTPSSDGSASDIEHAGGNNYLGVRPDLEPAFHLFEQHAYGTDLEEPAFDAFDDVSALKQRKTEYTAQVWQPRIDQILMEHGHAALNWQLTRWADIKRILEHLEYDPEERNHVLRQWKADYVDWERTKYQQPAQLLNESQIAAQQGPTRPYSSGEVLSNPGLVAPEPPQQASKGLYFRYAYALTDEERSHVDDMIGDYISFIMNNHSAGRYGYYVVLTEPGDPNQKELAYGIWNLQKGKKIEDADWFYTGLPKPSAFRPQEPHILHDWGYSIAPPSTKRAASKPTPKYESHDENYAFDNQTRELRSRSTRTRTRGRQSPRSSTSRRTNSVRFAPATRKRKGLMDDSEGDEDWQPE